MSIKKIVLISYATQIFCAGFGFISSIFITRLLGPEGRGEYAIFSNALALASVWLGFSLPSSVVYFIASKKADPVKLLWTMINFVMVSTVFLCICIGVLANTKAKTLVFPNPYNDFKFQILFVFQFIVLQFNGILNGFLNANKIFVPQAIFGAFISGITAILWGAIYQKYVRFTIQGFSLVAFLSAMIALPPLLYNVLLIRKIIPLKLNLFSLLSWAEFKQIIGYAFFIYIGNAIQYLNYRMDLWFIDFYHGKVAVGVYSLAVMLSQLAWILPSAMCSVLYTYISGASKQEGIALTVKHARWALYAVFLFALVFSTFAYKMIPIMYGREFYAASMLIIYRFIGIVPFSAAMIIATYFAGNKMVITNLKISILSFLICLTCDILFIKTYSIQGATAASILSYLCTFLLTMVIFLKRSGNVNLIHLFYDKNDFKLIESSLRIVPDRLKTLSIISAKIQKKISRSFLKTEL